MVLFLPSSCPFVCGREGNKRGGGKKFESSVLLAWKFFSVVKDLFSCFGFLGMIHREGITEHISL